MWVLAVGDDLPQIVIGPTVAREEIRQRRNGRLVVDRAKGLPYRQIAAQDHIQKPRSVSCNCTAVSSWCGTRSRIAWTADGRSSAMGQPEFHLGTLAGPAGDLDAAAEVGEAADHGPGDTEPTRRGRLRQSVIGDARTVVADADPDPVRLVLQQNPGRPTEIRTDATATGTGDMKGRSSAAIK